MITGSSSTPANLAFAAVLAIGIVGLVEDIAGLPVVYRLVAQAILSTTLSFGLLHAFQLSLWWATPLAILAVFAINTANFMDGVNGISAFHGILTGGIALTAGLISDSQSLAALGAVVAGAFIAFLPWNVPDARMFLGDSGSYALGASQWALAVYVWHNTGSPLLAIAPMTVYASDVLVTLVQRAKRGAKLTVAHREHMYQRIRQVYGRHLAASVYTAAFSFTASIIAVLVWTSSLPTFVGWGPILMVCAAYQILGKWLTTRVSRAKDGRR